jgi:2-(1,2-epoxy-1,2-dihydrophenyl)acetyl-CoA isomerase
MPDVLVDRDGAVLTLTLNRPDVYNAFNRALHAALAEGLAEAADPSVRAVVITGAGKGFCAGQDLKEFSELSGTGSIGDGLEATYHPNIRAIRALEKPVIAAVNGVAAGAGLSLAVACDVRIAADTATFVPGFVGIGLVPDSGGSWFLHRLLGFSRAFEWMTSNRRLSAAEALEWGLVSSVLPAEGFAEGVKEHAARWAEAPTRAVALTKRLFEQAFTNGLEEQLALEAELQGEASGTNDFGEGVAAFLEKRPPRFTGS